MKITIESTSQIVTLNGNVPGRVWEGRTASGVPVIAVVTRIAAAAENDLTEFERELVEHAPPSPEALGLIPTRLVL